MFKFLNVCAALAAIFVTTIPLHAQEWHPKAPEKGAKDWVRLTSGEWIHGTIDPSTIGREASMGCVRLRDKDIELLYQMLEPGRSTVHITW